MTSHKPVTHTSDADPSPSSSIDSSDSDPTSLSSSITPGQMFHLDYGFVQGSNCSATNDNGQTITSINGYNSYLLIEDKAT